MDDKIDAVVTFGMAWFVVAGVSFFGFTKNLDWLQIWIAPKVYLLEYASSLLSK